MQEKIGARVLLKNLRHAMAQATDPQQRLDKIVAAIASSMQSDVCSVYILRQNNDEDILELFATHGLNSAAVHKAQLKLGQGLIGTIAKRGRLLNIADAQQHPLFSYQPEVGEDEYHSLLGVPLIRAGRTIGVLVVRRKDFKIYPLDEIESLETTAMVLSDLVASGNIIASPQTSTLQAISLHGKKLSTNIAIGTIVRHDSQIIIDKLFNDDIDFEKKRLQQAIKKLRANFDVLVKNNLYDKGASGTSGEHIDVLNSLHMFAYDSSWIKRISQAIDDGLTAEAATKKVAQDNRLRLGRSNNSYLRHSLEDFEDLTRRLLQHLLGQTKTKTARQQKIIIVARTISAAELFDYYRQQNLIGLVLETATATSHAIIVARALRLAVVQAKNIINHCENGDEIIVDGFDGSIHLRPSLELLETYRNKQNFLKNFNRENKHANITKDGTKIKLLVNGALDFDVKQLKQNGADGIGLFRSELKFMLATRLPKLNQQIEFYKNILDLAKDKEITFRSLDIGGDKLLSYLPSEVENNPAMGWRAIRLAIDRPALLRIQLRALLRASADKNLRIKFPLISEIAEIKIAKQLLAGEIKTHKQFNYKMPASIKIGAMLEVPNLLWQLDELITEVDFVSVGSNDLFQFITASDRTNSNLANRYNPISHAFFRALRSIVFVANKYNKPLYLCGELAGEPLAVLGLLAIGYRQISMPADSLATIKKLLSQINLPELSCLVNNSLDEKFPRQKLLDILLNYVKQNDITI